MKKTRISTMIRPCTKTTCIRNSLCRNFTPKPLPNCVAFPSCMYWDTNTPK